MDGSYYDNCQRDNWCRPELGLQVSLRLGSVEGYGLST